MPVLDSDILVAALRGDEQTKNKIKSIKTEKCFTTVVSIIELFQGAMIHSKREEKVKDVYNLFSSINVYNLDFSSSVVAATIFSKNRLSGNIIDAFDVLIASICLAKNEKIITRNVSDFSRIKGLDIDKW